MKKLEFSAIQYRLMLIIFSFIFTGIIMSVLTIFTFRNVVVNGTQYNKIMLQSSLIADIMPPPEFLVESFLLCHILTLETDFELLEQHEKSILVLKDSYYSRYDYWRKTFPEGSNELNLLEGSNIMVDSFFTIVFKELVPSVYDGNKDVALFILREKLSPLFYQHKTIVVELMSSSINKMNILEEKVENIIHVRSKMIFLLLVFIFILLFYLTYRLMSKISFIESALVKNEEKYRTVADYTFDWEYWMNKDGEFLYVSPSCMRITGYTVDEFVNDSMLFSKIVHPEDKKLFKNHIKKISDPFQDKPENMDFRIITKDKEVRWISHYCHSVYDKNGDDIGRRASNRDITDRKVAEEELILNEKKFRNLFESSSNMLLIFNLNGEVLDANRMACVKLKMEKAELLKKNIDDIRTSFEGNSVDDKLEMYNRGENMLFGSNLIDSEGKVIPIESKSHLINYENTKAIFSILSDIGEQKKIHNRMMRTILETEEKERKRFATDLHDGLGATLSSVNLYLDLLNQPDITNEESQELIESALELVNEAISNSREIANNIRPNVITKFGLVSALSAMADKINALGKMKIQIDATRYISLMMKSDEENFFRIFQELVNNTLKHSSATLVNLFLDETDKSYIFTYEDNGEGFDYEKVDKVGKGAGIQNIKTRIQSICAEIHFYSKPGNGVFVKIEKDKYEADCK